MSHVLRASTPNILRSSYPLFSTPTLMSESKSKKSPPPSKLSTPLTTATRRGMSDDIHSDRLLAYKPIVTPKVKPGPVRLNTKGKPPSGRNVGKLADLLKMPIDVFCEVRNWGSVCTRLILVTQIVSYLHPLDILQLARVSLKVRAILMSRNSAHVWIIARRTIGMPECPPDLSEPQYASLVFEHTCFVSDRLP